jgi:hypothetical protein
MGHPTRHCLLELWNVQHGEWLFASVVTTARKISYKPSTTLRPLRAQVTAEALILPSRSIRGFLSPLFGIGWKKPDITARDFEEFKLFLQTIIGDADITLLRSSGIYRKLSASCSRTCIVYEFTTLPSSLLAQHLPYIVINNDGLLID